MSKRKNDSKENIKQEDLEHEVEELVEELTDEDWEINEEQVDDIAWDNEVARLKDALARQQADYDNFKKRTSRDKEEMVFFLKSKIISPVLKRVDDIERIITNTPEENQNWAIYEWILALEKALKKDLSDQWVKEFSSLGDEVDPHKHDVMTQVPGQEPWIVFDEFEKWYMLDEKVLRVAKVVVWSSE